MCGNRIGFKFSREEEYFKSSYGTFVIELKEDVSDSRLEELGYTSCEPEVKLATGETFKLEKLLSLWTSPLEKVFPTKKAVEYTKIENVLSDKKPIIKAKALLAKPRVFIPVFPGSNCEYDLTKAFEDAGAVVNVGVFTNLSSKNVEQSIDMFEKEIAKSQIIMIPGGFSAGDEPEGSGKFIAAVFRNPRLLDAIHKHLNENDGLMLGICNGFQALIKLGLVPYGKIIDMTDKHPTLTFNNIARHQSRLVTTKVTSKLSPWFSKVELGEEFVIPLSHGEGRFVASEEVLKELIANGQVATQYVDLEGNATYDIDYNPNGSLYGIEGITSIDGRVLGKMAHSERSQTGTIKNVPGNMDQKLFESGVEYYK